MGQEDDTTKRTRALEVDDREAWLAAELAKEAIQRSQRIRERMENHKHTSFHRPVTPEELAELKRVGDEAIARMQATACKGDRDNLHLCTSAVEAACNRRDYNSCPRRIIAHERGLQKAHEGGRTEYDALLAKGIPKPMARILVGNRQRDTKATTVAAEWWSASPRPVVLVIAGDPGIGKSFAAAGVVARFGGLFVPVSEIVARKWEEGFMPSLRVPGILVIDDLGTEVLGSDGHNRSAISSLICNRVDAGQLTLLPLMTNVEDIRPRYGDHVADRIQKLGRVRKIADVSQRNLADWTPPETENDE